MCGIVGLFGNITPARLGTFEEMFQINVLRGTDSCGIAVIKDNQPTVVKDIVWPDELLTEQEYNDVTTNLEGVTAIIGHNRAQTRGVVSQKNAHPFTHGNITLVHNGTVWTYRFPDSDKDTDSETICDHINRHGIDKVWKMIDGAAALAYHNAETSKLYLITNDKRPLWFMNMGDHMFFSSEPWMMLTAAFRNKTPVNVKELWSLKKNMLYEFDFQDGKVVYTSRELQEFVHQTGRRVGYWQGGRYHSYDETNLTYADFGYGYECIDETEDGGGELLPHARDCNCSECCASRVAAYNQLIEDGRKREAADAAANFPGEKGYTPADSSTKSEWATLGFPASRRVALLKVNSIHKRIDEDDWHKNYNTCSCCGRSIKDSYLTAMIIDYFTHDALCGVCTAVGEFHAAPASPETSIH